MCRVCQLMWDYHGLIKIFPLLCINQQWPVVTHGSGSITLQQPSDRRSQRLFSSQPEWNIDPALPWVVGGSRCSVLNINAPSEFPQPLFDSGNRERGGSSGRHICSAQQPNCDSSNNWREVSANGSRAATCTDQSQHAGNTGGQSHEIHRIHRIRTLRY